MKIAFMQKFNTKIKLSTSTISIFNSSGSVASGGVEGYSPLPIGMQSMQNTKFLALLRPIFALKAK